MEEEDWIDVVEKMTCVFCDRHFKKYNKKFQKVTTTTLPTKISQIINILRIQNEEEKLKKFENSASLCYHTSCLSVLDYKHVKALTPKKTSTLVSDWTSKRTIHSAAFTKLSKIITESLIDNGGVQSISDIYTTYMAIFEEEKLKSKATLPESGVFSQQHLLKKIIENFPSITKTLYKGRTFVHRFDLSPQEILGVGFESKSDWSSQIKAVAYHIRQCIMNMKTRPLPKKNISLQDILGGECDCPDELNLFISALLNGPNGSKSVRKQKRIECISHSIIFSMSNGSIKPATSLYLGMATKSMTGSKKLIQILNRMGFCISYTIAEELETELAYGSSMKERILPDGLIANRPELRTHLAFDNYDRYVETATGKDTMHDTVGIVHQNIVKDIQTRNVQGRIPTRINEQTGTRRRNYQSSFNASVEPYFRANKTQPALIGNAPVLPTSLEMSLKLDYIWMLHHALYPNTKRWFAWNAERTVDPNPLQKIAYLPNINMSPTSEAVVKKTLEIAQSLAKDCQQKYIIVTFDLAIACKAYKIKADLAPLFDDVFVTLGAFHVELAYFKVSISNEALVFY